MADLLGEMSRTEVEQRLFVLLGVCGHQRPKLHRFENEVLRCDNKEGHRGPHWSRTGDKRWTTEGRRV